ncbi:DNA helicase, partial [Tanacetum coccineum]
MTEANNPNIIPMDKGKLPLVEATTVSLADIKPRQTNKTIEVRVYRKWVAKNVRTQVASNFCAILLDKEGNAIQANMDLRDTDYFNDLLQLNNAYRILPYNEVNQRADINGAPLIDYIGCIYRISDPIRTGDATRTRRTRCIIDIQNLEYPDLINPVPALEIQRQPYSNPLLEQTRNRYSIEALLSVNPQHYEQIRFTTEATLLEITAPNGWYYRKCNACNVKVSDNSDVSECHNHGSQPTPNYGYCFKAIINDGTATATITCFSPEAHTFVPDCNTVVNTIEDKNPNHVPPVLKEAEGHVYIFQYHFGPKARPGYPNFTLNAVLKPLTELLLALPATEPTKSPPAEILEGPSSGANTTTTDEGPTSPAKNDAQNLPQNPEENRKKQDALCSK